MRRDSSWQQTVATIASELLLDPDYRSRKDRKIVEFARIVEFAADIADLIAEERRKRNSYDLEEQAQQVI